MNYLSESCIKIVTIGFNINWNERKFCVNTITDNNPKWDYIIYYATPMESTLKIGTVGVAAKEYNKRWSNIN